MWTLLFVCLTLAEARPPPPEGWPPPPASSTVASVYDGDTVTLATGDRIRLRWVNTPELRPLEPYAIDARNAAEQFLAGKEVKLLLSGENPRDGYGRVVAGLQTEEGNLSVHLLEKGLAHLFVIPPDDTDLTPFIEAQRRARAAKLGIWSTDSYQGTLHITSFHANARGDDRLNVNGEYVRVCNITTEPLNVEGYRVMDASGNSWTLPSLTIPPGHTATIHSGVGQHQANPSAQLQIFLGSDKPIWNNDGDKVTILDRFGRVVDAREHAPRKK